MPGGLERAHAIGLVGGPHFRHHVVRGDSRGLGDRRRRAPMVPVIIHGSRPRPRNSATASPAPGFSASARAMRPRKVPSRATRMDVPPRAAAASTATSAPLISTPWSARSAGPPTSTVAPSTTAVAPRPAMAWKSFGVPSARCRSRCGTTTATPSGCSDAELDARREPEQLVLADAGDRRELGEGRPADSQRAGLVEHDRCRLSARPRAPRRHG